MPTIDNTDRAVRAAKLLNNRQTEYAIKGVNGLRLHIQPSGKHKWYFHYWLWVDGKRKHRALPLGYADLEASSKGFRQVKAPSGEAAEAPRKEAEGRPEKTMSRAEAVKRALRAQLDLTDGKDPAGERQAQAAKVKRGLAFKTLDDMTEAWLKKTVRGKQKSSEETERRYRRHVQPAIGKLAPTEIERGHVIQLLEDAHNKIRAKDGNDDPKRGGHEVNRVQHLIHAVYGWAISEGVLPAKSDPTYRLRYRFKEEPRQRALSPAEIKAIWHGLDITGFKTDPAHGPITTELRAVYRLLILLGQRKMEVAGMTKDELDLDGDLPVWTIPGSRTKNGVTHRLPLPSLALAIVREAVERSTGTYVFPSWQTGRPYSSTGVGSVSRLLRAELELGDDVRVHDFRRTVGTQMASLRISAEDRARVFNHVRGAKTNTTTKVYDVYAYDQEKLDALEKWETRVRTIISDNVIPLTKQRASA
jgi:integrase